MFLNPLNPITSRQKVLLVLIFVLIVLFGIWVEIRGAYLQRPMTDLGVYLRSAYAVKTGLDIYKITDDNDWHYVYPPFFAIVITPLADPPKGVDRTGYLPYKFTVGFWYVLTMLFGLLGVHILAKALQEYSSLDLTNHLEDKKKPNVTANKWDFINRPQVWWAIRVIPFLILLVPIGRSQMRGQVGLIIAFLICMMCSAILKGKRFQAGIWLSVATAIKVIPVYLFIVPLWRRDWRMIFGGLVGLFITLLVIPLFALGVDNTVSSYKSFFNEVLLAGVKGSSDTSRGGELTCISCTDSNSPMTVMHNIIHPDRISRPREATTFVREAHWLLALVMTLMTIYYAKWQGDKWYCHKVDEDLKEILFVGLLLLLMCIISPVFHPHYISMIIPLIMVMLWMLWQRYGYRKEPIAYKIIFWFLIVSHIVTSIGGIFWFARDFGLVLFSSLLLWLLGLQLLKQGFAHER